MQHVFEFPATRGVQAGRVFYTVTAPIGTLHRLITIDNRTGVMTRSQRDVDQARAKKVSEYITANPNSWVLPALTGCIDDEPSFRAMLGEQVGVLVIPMHSTIRLFDGQHRATGLMSAVTNNPELRANSVTIQIYVGMALEDRQQAFTDINMNAKPVSKGLSMVYNHRDTANRSIADAVNSVQAWSGKIEWQKASCSGVSEKLFPFKGVVEAVYIYAGSSRKIQPTTEQVAEAMDFFGKVSEFAAWDDGVNADGDDMKYYRESWITYHVIGLKALALYGYQARRAGLSVSEAADLLEPLKDRFARSNNADWSGCCMDFEGRMKSSKEALIATAKRIVSLSGLPTELLSW